MSIYLGRSIILHSNILSSRLTKTVSKCSVSNFLYYRLNTELSKELDKQSLSFSAIIQQ